MSDNKPDPLVAMALTMGAMIFIALIITGYSYCNRADQRKLDCIERTHDAHGCDCLLGRGYACTDK